MIQEGTSTEASGIFALMAFLADKDACLNRLNQLTAVAQDAYGARSEAQRIANETVAAEQALADLKVAAETEQANADKAKKEAADASAIVDARTKAVADAEAEVKRNADINTAVAASLADREQKVSDREAAVQIGEATLVKAQAEYDDKVAKLRVFVS